MKETKFIYKGPDTGRVSSIRFLKRKMNWELFGLIMAFTFAGAVFGFAIATLLWKKLL